jgi:electron transfer flavoprotein beta subunit
MKARGIKVTSWTAADINADQNLCGLKGSPTKVVKIFPPVPRGQREILSGTLEEQAVTVVRKLKEQSLI